VIVQSAPEGRPHACIAMAEHERFAGELARAFGNAAFEKQGLPGVFEELVAHHDDGWALVDPTIGQDPRTGLPYNLVATPVKDIVKTGAHGPDLNEARSIYAGLLSSMHTYGLYTGRYGLSDKIFVDKVGEEDRPAVRAMLDHELARQARLRAAIEATPELAPWVSEARLWGAYKALQFFDTLALYFHMTHDEARGPSTFKGVPRGDGNDVMVTVRREAAHVYALEPFPFGEDPLEVRYEARLFAPVEAGAPVASLLREAPVFTETLTLKRGAA
jgi:Protein of unknown function (DUF3891)